MRPVSFVICAAGRGERFRKFGLTSPKPKLLLNGLSMLERSLDSLDLETNDQVIVISQRSDELPKRFSHLQGIQWLEIDHMTKGQLDTFLLASDLLIHQDIVIYNCDTFFEAKNLRSLIDSGEFEGIIPCSKEPGLSWSFCDVDQAGNILKVTEKQRISDWASVGYYYFKNKNLLINLARQHVASVKNEESYVAPLYNKYIEQGLKLKMVEVDRFLPFGTVEQVQDYWGVSVDELLKENK